MGSEAVIFVLLAVIVFIVILWRDDKVEKRQAVARHKEVLSTRDSTLERLTTALHESTEHNAKLEAEIQRLRTIPLTQKPDKTENAVIKAKSPAQVRQITEAAWGKFEEIKNGS